MYFSSFLFSLPVFFSFPFKYSYLFGAVDVPLWFSAPTLGAFYVDVKRAHSAAFGMEKNKSVELDLGFPRLCCRHFPVFFLIDWYPFVLLPLLIPCKRLSRSLTHPTTPILTTLNLIWSFDEILVIRSATNFSLHFSLIYFLLLLLLFLKWYLLIGKSSTIFRLWNIELVVSTHCA